MSELQLYKIINDVADRNQAPPHCSADGSKISRPPSHSSAVVAEARGHTLKFKTCNASQAGTLDPLSLSFCGGDSDCDMGPLNDYNLRGELELAGVWNQFEVPLEYEPTTMEITIKGIDAWCVLMAACSVCCVLFSLLPGLLCSCYCCWSYCPPTVQPTVVFSLLFRLLFRLLFSLLFRALPR